MPLLVFRMSLKPQQLQELPIVRPILKDILMIDTPEHHVVYTCTTLFSWFSWHSFSKRCCKDKEKTTNRQKKVHKSTQKEPSLLCTDTPFFDVVTVKYLKQIIVPKFYEKWCDNICYLCTATRRRSRQLWCIYRKVATFLRGAPGSPYYSQLSKSWKK